MRDAIVEPKADLDADSDRGEAVVGHIGLDFDVVVVDQGDDGFADLEVGADLGVAQGDDAVEGRANLGVGEVVRSDPEVGAGTLDSGVDLLDKGDGFLNLGAGEVDVAQGGHGRLALVVEAGLGKRHGIAQFLVAVQLLAGLGEAGLGAPHTSLGHGVTRFGAGQGGIAFGDLGGDDIAAPGQTIAVDHREDVAGADPVANLDAELADRPADKRRHLATLARHQAADHREGLAQWLGPHRIDLDQDRLVLGGRVGRRRKHREQGGQGN